MSNENHNALLLKSPITYLNHLLYIISQLTDETYAIATASFAQIIEQTENSQVEQNSEVLNTAAQYLDELATFVNETMITINDTVR